MATEQGSRLSFCGRTTLGNIVRLIPALVIIAATLNTLSCGSSGLLSPAGSGSPTAIPTTGTGALAFVTNYNDGKVSSFTRNITTGALKHTGQVTAGKKGKSGPRGVVASPNGSFSIRREYQRRQYLRVLDQFERNSDSAAYALDP